VTGKGIPEWLAWLAQGAGSARAAHCKTVEPSDTGPAGPQADLERSLTQ